MIRIRTICSLVITLCWSVIVLLYVVSHKHVVTHAVKSKGINRGCNTSVGQEKEHQMCLLHFSNTSHHIIRVVRNTDKDAYLPATAYWKRIPFLAACSDASFLYFNQVDCSQHTADRIILFQQIRI